MGISVSSILLFRKRRTSMCAALRVYPMALAAPHGAHKAQGKSKIKCVGVAG
jgi:hypothetical protein